MSIQQKNTLKNLIKKAMVSTSAMAIMLGGGNAVAAAVGSGGIIVLNNANIDDGAAQNSIHGITAAGADTTVAKALVDGDAVTYGGQFNLNVNVPYNIQAINVNNNPNTTLTLTSGNQLGSVVDTGANNEKLNIFYKNATGLTLTGADATAANHGFTAPLNTYNIEIDFNHVAILPANPSANLIVQAQNGNAITLDPSTVAQNGENAGVLVMTPFNVGGRTFQDVSLVTVETNKGIYTCASNDANGIVANNVYLQNEGSAVFTNNFVSVNPVPYQLNVNGTLASATPVGTNHVITIDLRNAPIAITGSLGGAKKVNEVPNVLNNITFTGDQNATINLAGVPNISPGIDTGQITFSHSVGNIIWNNLINLPNSAMVFTSNATPGSGTGTVTFNQPLTIDGIDFAGNAGTIQLGNGQTINAGAVQSSTVTAGILNFLGGGTVDATITDLAAVNFNGAGNVSLPQAASATTFTVNDAGANVNAGGLVTGNLNYTAAGAFTINNGLTGSVTTAAGGTLNYC